MTKKRSPAKRVKRRKTARQSHVLVQVSRNGRIVYAGSGPLMAFSPPGEGGVVGVSFADESWKAILKPPAKIGKSRRKLYPDDGGLDLVEGMADKKIAWPVKSR